MEFGEEEEKSKETTAFRRKLGLSLELATAMYVGVT